MHTAQSIQVKICCISSQQEAELAIRHGATALGLVGPMPSGPGVISNDKIKSIASIIPQCIDSFLLSSETSSEGIITHYNKTKTNTIQIVDALDSLAYKDLRDALPAVKIVQVIHVVDESSIQEAKKIAPIVDAILLDSGNPKLKIKELGGTGRVHNWNISRSICAAVSVPVYLAGGLNADNVRAAIDHVQPDGVDLCSGVRTDGKLDEKKLKAFFDAVNIHKNQETHV